MEPIFNLKDIKSLVQTAKTGQDINHLLHSVLERAIGILKASSGMIFFKNRKNGELTWGAAIGLSDPFVMSFKEKPICPGEGLTGIISETGKPIFIDYDSSNDKRIVRQIIREESLNSFIGVPIFFNEEVIGVMNILTRAPDILKESDIVICEGIASEVALVIRNAILISEINDVENLLNISEEKYRHITEAIPDPLYISSKDYVIEYMNPAMVKRVGRDAYGEQCYKALFGCDSPCDWCEAFSENNNRPVVKEIKSEEEGRFFLMNSTPMTLPDGSSSVMVIFRDITKLKLDELEREKQKERMNQVMRLEALGNLAGGVAHDFNNILGAIIGYAELSLLKEDCLEKDIQENLEGIIEASDRAKELIKQILIFARKSKEEKIHINIQSMVKETLKFLRATVPTSIHFQQNLNSQSFINASPAHIHQIIMNICTNAVHAMGYQDGTLTVNLKDTFIDPLSHPKDVHLLPGKYVELSIADTGCGIPEDIMELIFDPYFTTKQEDEGTGLGLATVFGIVKEYNGDVAVSSVPGVGSTFTLYLPVYDSPQESENSDQCMPLKGTESVLVVDDETTLAKVITEQLIYYGYDAVYRDDGSDALELFSENPDRFDLVVTDMNMPGMSGDTLSEHLLKIKPELPIIMCTGYTQKITENSAQKLGIRSLLYKPVHGNDIIKEIRALFTK